MRVAARRSSAAVHTDGVAVRLRVRGHRRHRRRRRRARDRQGRSEGTRPRRRPDVAAATAPRAPRRGDRGRGIRVPPTRSLRLCEMPRDGSRQRNRSRRARDGPVPGGSRAPRLVVVRRCFLRHFLLRCFLLRHFLLRHSHPTGGDVRTGVRDARRSVRPRADPRRRPSVARRRQRVPLPRRGERLRSHREGTGGRRRRALRERTRLFVPPGCERARNSSRFRRRRARSADDDPRGYARGKSRIREERDFERRRRGGPSKDRVRGAGRARRGADARGGGSTTRNRPRRRRHRGGCRGHRRGGVGVVAPGRHRRLRVAVRPRIRRAGRRGGEPLDRHRRVGGCRERDAD
mmetsp:Transcript_10039/g.41390  ORF Transcript_10039/g.41390 Transcript_10039/m.41390 type:complete len:348 (-) Transcript_10039:772-1815(-)